MRVVLGLYKFKFQDVHLPKTKKMINNLRKQILTALAGATVSLGATFSLLAPSAQAASFTTEFKNGDGNVVFELDWSGEFGDDGVISGADGELTGKWTVRYDGKAQSLGDASLFKYSDFEYSLSSGLDWKNDKLRVGTDAWNLKGGIDRGFGLNEFYGGSGNLAFTESPYVTSSQTVIREEVSTPEPSLTLSFITLGGLMLGGTIKNRKGKSQEV